MIFEKNSSCLELLAKEIPEHFSGIGSANVFNEFRKLLEFAIHSHQSKDIELYQQVDTKLIDIQNYIFSKTQVELDRIVSESLSVVKEEKLKLLEFQQKELYQYKDFLESCMQLKFNERNLVQYPIPITIRLQMDFKNKLDGINRLIKQLKVHHKTKKLDHTEFILKQDKKKVNIIFGDIAQRKLSALKDAKKREIVPKYLEIFD